MAFHTKEFDVFVVLGGPQSELPWSHGKWAQLSEILDPVVIPHDKCLAVRTTQIGKTTGKKVSFGKLGWDKKSQSRWTHGSPANMQESLDWRFLSMETWSPSWTQCEKLNEAPDLFISLSNEHTYGDTQSSQFSSTLICALSVSQPVVCRDELASSMKVIARALSSPLTVRKLRFWAQPFGTGFTNALNDLGLVGLFKPGRRHERPLDLNTFSETWELF